MQLRIFKSVSSEEFYEFSWEFFGIFSAAFRDASESFILLFTLITLCSRTSSLTHVACENPREFLLMQKIIRTKRFMIDASWFVIFLLRTRTIRDAWENDLQLKILESNFFGELFTRNYRFEVFKLSSLKASNNFDASCKIPFGFEPITIRLVFLLFNEFRNIFSTHKK